MARRTQPISQQKLFIEELERPVPASINLPGTVTTLAVGEECDKGK